MTTKQQYRALATVRYGRRIKSKSLVPGKVRNMSFKGQKVKVLLDKTGRKLSIVEASKDAVTDIRRAETLRIDDGKLRPIYKPTQPKPQPKVEAPTKPPEPPAEPPKPPETSPPKPYSPPKTLSEEEMRRRAALVPVPDKGPIPTPYINWDEIPEYCKVSGVKFMDYPNKYNKDGWLPELREAFRRARHQGRVPINVLIMGPPGTGKSELIKKFAEDTGLPYWGVIGREGIRADELLGSYTMKEGTSRWVEGIIPKAVRAGGILHFDEPNVIDPAVLTRLDELMDNKRQLDLRDINGPLIKAHPDLFIVFTQNPPTYEGVKDLPPPVKNRLKPVYRMDYPPQATELNILKWKMALSDAEFKVTGPSLSGVFSREISDFMKIVNGLRGQTDLSYTPSLRDTQYFVQCLKEGDNFYKAFDTSLKENYWGEEADRVEEALNAVRRRT
jgi:hypothetical protein